jgi:hypothetical protein
MYFLVFSQPRPVYMAAKDNCTVHTTKNAIYTVHKWGVC